MDEATACMSVRERRLSSRLTLRAWLRSGFGVRSGTFASRKSSSNDSARASSSYQPQYLRITALALMDHGGDAEARGARELLVRLIETYPGSSDVVMAHDHLGELDAR